MHVRHGTSPANQLGLLPRSFRKESSRCLPVFQLQSFDHRLEFLAGTQAGFDRATNRIRDIGRCLRNWPESRRTVNECNGDITSTTADAPSSWCVLASVLLSLARGIPV